jgi:tetratricopeptide (TPR) repeat protein
MNLKSISRRYAPVIPALIALAVYATTVCRSIWIGDGAEFALALQTLGIAHPPGYPLFVIAGSVFVQMLSFLRPVFAANLFSVFVSSAAVAVVFAIFRKRLGDLSAGFLSLVWAFVPLFWAQLSGVEVYNLNILLISLTILAMASRQPWRWPLTLYLFGLCLTVHPSSLSLAPALVFLFIHEKEYRNWRRLPLYVGLVLLAGTMYFYLWVRAAQNPISDWGHPVGVSALWQHMSLKQYSGWVSNSWESLFITLKLYWTSVIGSWWWLGTLAIVTGIYHGLRLNRTHTIAALLILATSLFLSAFHQAVDYEPFFLVPMLASLLLIGNNLLWLQKRRVPSAALCAAGAVAALAMVCFHYQDNDQSGYTLYEDYSKLILDAAREGVLYTAGDINSFGTLYLRYAEGYRPDVEVYDRSIRKRALLDKAKQLAGRATDDYYAARRTLFALEKRPQFIAKNHYINEPEWLPAADSLHSYGMIYQLLQAPTDRASMPSYPADYDPGDLMSRELLANIDLSRGEEKLLIPPFDSIDARRDFVMAIGRMKNEPRGLLLNNIGIYLRLIGFGDLALDAYHQALQKPLLSQTQRDEIIFNISNVYKDRGNAALQRNDFVTAVAGFVEAASYDPRNSRLLLNIGLIYAQNLNDRVNALMYLNQYLELEPSDSRVRALVQSLR